MKLWPFGRKQQEAKYSEAGPNISLSVLGQPVWTPRDYESLARESYLFNAVAYRCVKMIATSAAMAPWMLAGKGGKEIEAHPLLDLLRHPGPGTNGAAFMEALVAYFLLAGNSYIEAVGPKNGPPKELWVLRPDRMQVIAGSYGLPRGYRYTVNGLQKDWDVDPLTGVGPVLHIKDFNPVNDWYGMSRIEAAAYGIDRHNAASSHNKALLDNGARPSGALVFKPIKNGDAVTSAPQDIIDAAEKRLNETHSGPANAGKSFTFSGDVNWVEMSTTPKDMDFATGKDDAARDICAAIGVPHVLLVPGASTYNNVREAKLELYEETVLPILKAIASALNSWLVPKFGDGLTLAVDEDGISALEPRREIRRNSAIKLMDSGVIDGDEAREMLLYGPRSASAVKKVDAAVVAALVDLAENNGITPLFRYLLSVGLLPPNAKLESFTLDALRDMTDEFEPPDDDPDDDPEGSTNADQG